MPGANCSIYGCSTSRKAKGVSIFKIPAAKTPFTTKWREELISVITRDRVLDDDLRRQIKEDRLHICEKHFEQDKMSIYASWKSLKDGALPTLNLPKKSIPNKRKEPRSTELFKKRAEFEAKTVDTVKKLYYKDLDAVKKGISLIKAAGWNFSLSADAVKILRHDDYYLVPKYEIHIDDSLGFTIRVLGWKLPENHPIYVENLRTIKFLTLSRLMQLIE